MDLEDWVRGVHPRITGLELAGQATDFSRDSLIDQADLPGHRAGKEVLGRPARRAELHLDTAVNSAPEYADLRRVYASRVAAQWYRERSATKTTATRATNSR